MLLKSIIKIILNFIIILFIHCKSKKNKSPCDEFYYIKNQKIAEIKINISPD